MARKPKALNEDERSGPERDWNLRKKTKQSAESESKQNNRVREEKNDYLNVEACW